MTTEIDLKQCPNVCKMARKMFLIFWMNFGRVCWGRFVGVCASGRKSMLLKQFSRKKRTATWWVGRRKDFQLRQNEFFAFIRAIFMTDLTVILRDALNNWQSCHFCTLFSFLRNSLATFPKSYGLKTCPRQFVTTWCYSFFDASSGSVTNST